jgi:hypothetical protein
MEVLMLLVTPFDTTPNTISIQVVPREQSLFPLFRSRPRSAGYFLVWSLPSESRNDRFGSPHMMLRSAYDRHEPEGYLGNVG